jgi:exosortase
MSVQISKRTVLFLALLAASIVLWRHRMSTVLGLALGNESYTHILLIVPLSCGLIYLRRDVLTPVFEASVLAGTSLLCASLLIAGVAKYLASLPAGVPLSLSIFALVLWWIGSVILCYGIDAFRSLCFPLCFLFLLVPLPVAALDSVIGFLQRESAFSARVLFRLANVPVTQDGFVLSIPDLDVEVARECSSIRSSMMLVVTTLILAQLFLRSWWRRLLLLAIAIPLSVAKNGFRIFVIAELGTRVDPAYLTGNLHHHGGPVFLALAFAATTAILLVLRRSEAPRYSA